jgi:hypothetical protein
MDLVQATGGGEELTLGGQTFNIRLLILLEWAEVQKFLKKELPSPITRVGIAVDQAWDAGTPLKQATIDALYDRAERAALTWPPRIGTKEWFDGLDTIEGGWERVLFEVVSKTHPAFTLAQANELAPKVKANEWADLIRVSLWGTHPAPKGEGAEPEPPASPSATTGIG